MSLFDQFQRVIANPGAAMSGAKPEYLVNLDQSIDVVWDKISTLFYELGKYYYEQHVEDHQTEFEEQLEVIRAAYTEISQYQKLADEVSARKRCPTCGSNLMEGAVFCSICGAKLPEASGSAEDQRVCPQCHALVGADDAFCNQCGATIIT